MLVLNMFIDIQTSKELIQMDNNEMMTVLYKSRFDWAGNTQYVN